MVVVVAAAVEDREAQHGATCSPVVAVAEVVVVVVVAVAGDMVGEHVATCSLVAAGAAAVRPLSSFYSPSSGL